jgi:outer membrane receptor protein involved in Fe transport
MSSMSTLHSTLLHLPIVTTVLSVVFAAILFSRYRRNGGGLHLLWWGIGMVTYGVGTMTEAYTTLFGWNPVVFKFWYVAGAFLGGYPLAQGSIYLLMNRRFARWSAWIACSLIAIGAILVFLSPVNVAAAEPHRLSGRVLEWQWLRAISPLLNLYSVGFLVGGAAISALRYRRNPAASNRYAGNIAIAVGGLLPAIGGTMTRFGVVEALYITELAGLLLIFRGYRWCVGEPSNVTVLQRKPAVAAAMLLLLFPLNSVADDAPAKTPEATPAAIVDAGSPPPPTADTSTPSFFAETTVTATGSKRDVFELATPVTVIREETITQKLPQNAADLLREQPGVDVNGVGPNQERPVIRGQRGLRVLFLENGLRMNNPRRQTDFGEMTGLVDLNSVSTIEVVRGPASVLYGTDAIGGVLNLISKDPTFPGPSNYTGFVEGRYSNSGSLASGSAGLNAKFGNLTLQLGGTKRQVDDYSVPSGQFGDIRLQHGTDVLDTGVHDSSIWGSAAFAATDRDRFRFRFNRYRADQTGFGYVPGSLYGVTEDAKIRIFYPTQAFDRYTLSYQGSPLEQWWAESTNVQLYFQDNKRQLANDITIDIGPVRPGFPHSTVHADTLNHSDVRTFGIRSDAVKVLSSGRHIVTYGFEGTHDHSDNTDSSLTTTTIRTPGGDFVSKSPDTLANAPNATNLSYGVFGQDEVTLTSRLRMTAGLRYHNVKTEALATPGWDITGLDFSDRNVVGALTTTYQVTGYLNFLASYGRGFRSPNIIERLFNGLTPEGSGFQLLNPALKSETSNNFDLGMKYRRWDAFMEAVAFRNDIRGGIIQAFLSPEEIAQLDPATRAAIGSSHAQFVVQDRNTERLRYQGLELALGWHSHSGLTLGGNYTWIDGNRIDSINPPTGDSYSKKIYAYVRYQPKDSRFWMEYHARHNGAVAANLDPNQPVPPVGRTLPSFTVQGAGAGMRLFETAGFANDVTFWVENLTNQLYAEFSNATFFRPEPGRTAKISYRVTF